MSKLKVASYRHLMGGCLGPESNCNDNRVAYWRKGRSIVFSAIGRPSYSTSSINAAAEIVLVILQAEGLTLGQVDFFDLQTVTGYDIFEPGEYRLWKLIIKPSKDRPAPLNFRVEWDWYLASEETLQIFSRFIIRGQAMGIVNEHKKDGHDTRFWPIAV